MKLQIGKSKQKLILIADPQPMRRGPKARRTLRNTSKFLCKGGFKILSFFECIVNGRRGEGDFFYFFEKPMC